MRDLQEIASDLSTIIAKEYTLDELFSIFTTIRYDSRISPPIYLLDKHIEKLKRACDFFDFECESLCYEDIEQHIYNALSKSESYPKSAFRIKLIISKNGISNIEFAELPDSHKLTTNIPDYIKIQQLDLYNANWKENDGWLLYFDTEKTLPTQFTSFKTTNRETYNNARKRFNIVPGDHREVLLHDMNDNILEGSITSVAFWRKHRDPITNVESFKWVTPHLGLGCMDGVMRKFYLDNNMIVQDTISAKNLIDGEFVLIMNALMGVKLSKLILG